MTAVKPLVHEYNQLIRGPQPYSTQGRAPVLRGLLDRVVGKLRQAAGASELYPYFGEQFRTFH